jgi:uncharacterized repeat protein (TIGR01451 family)
MQRLIVSLILGLSAATAAAQPALEITKSCPKLRYLGREASFEIVVTNKGSSPAANVVVTDSMVGAGFVSADNGGTRSGDTITWSLGSLDAGQSRTLKVVAACNTIGVIRNRARVTWCAEAAAECETEVRGIPAILLECVDDPDPIEVGGTLTYTITVTNQGTEVGTNIVVNCTLPPEQEYVSTGGATTGTNSGKAVSFAPLPSLAPKAKATFTVTVKGVSPADSRFKVEMKSDQIDSPVMETESTHIYD